MKLLYIFSIILSLQACGEQKAVANSESGNEVVVETSEQDTFTILKMGKLTPYGITMLKLKKITSDNRCPEGVQCIWAGEATAIIGLYYKGKFQKDIEVTFSPKETNDNNPMLLFSENGQSYHAMSLSPYPKSGNKIDSKSYEIKIAITPEG